MSLLDPLRRPEYTGENRCWPCTAVNGALVAAGALLAGLLSPLVGLLLLLGGSALVALRGYVVPYTPRFAPQIAAALPVDFGAADAPRPSDGLVEGADDPERLLTALFEAGVLREDADGGLELDPTFTADWDAGVADLRGRDDAAVAAAAADAAPFDATGEAHGDLLLVAGPRDAWLSRAVAIADAAAVGALVDRGLDREVAAAAAQPLRTFLADCPDCGGPVVETTLRNCCGGTYGVYDSPGREALACRDCEAVLAVFEE